MDSHERADRQRLWPTDQKRTCELQRSPRKIVNPSPQGHFDGNFSPSIRTLARDHRGIRSWLSRI